MGTSHHQRFIAAAHAHQRGDESTVRRAVGVLAADAPDAVATQIATLLEQQVHDLWDRGWQPSDVWRIVGRDLGGPEQALIRHVVASGAARYERLGAEVAPAWMAQLQMHDLRHDWDLTRPYLLQVRCPWPEVILAAVRLLGLVSRLPALPLLMDPPSAWRTGMPTGTASLPGPVLDKIRALLAKAESTTFDAEAEAFTAKAQELMARHRIDRAVLDAGSERHGEEPAGRRLGVDDPYADAKAALLGNVAGANGCRAVWSKGLGFTTVFGFPDELDAVEELFTSLLVQSTAALRREGSKHDCFGRSRTTRFRRSFLVAFAVRIGQRLSETVDATVASAEAEYGGALLPALASRDLATRTALEAVFPDIRAFSPRASDAEGWRAGTVFGDRADLTLAPAHALRSPERTRP